MTITQLLILIIGLEFAVMMAIFLIREFFDIRITRRKKFKLQVAFEDERPHINLYPVKRTVPYGKGLIHYFDYKGKEEFVVQANGEKVSVLEGRYTIGRKIGSVQCVQLFEYQPSAPASEYAILLKTHFMKDGYTAMKGEGSNKLMGWLLGGLLAVVVIAGAVWFFNRDNTVPEPVPVEQTTPVDVSEG